MKKIIIIGSGISGLTAANLLAKKGHKVTVFESHSTPGGYTSGFYRKGFYFESGTVSFEFGPTVFKAMQDIGVLDKVKFIKQKNRWISPDFDVTPQSYTELKQALFSAYPDHKDKLISYTDEVEKMCKAVPLSKKPMPLLETGFKRLWETILFISSGLKLVPLLCKYGNLTINEFAQKYFPIDSKPYSIFTDLGYPEMSAWLLGPSINTILGDYWMPQNGMLDWIKVLCDNFVSLGGEIKYNSYVNRIITKDGAAIGVVSSDGLYEADFVIAACDYKNTFLNLIDPSEFLSFEAQEKIKNTPVCNGFFTVYLGLNISNQKLREYLKIPHMVIFDANKKSLKVDLSNKDYFKTCSYMLFSPSLVNSNHAPADKSSLMIMAVVPRNWMDQWQRDDRAKYLSLKEIVKNTLIEKAEKIIPGLREAIVLKDAATPLTYERYTHNNNGSSCTWSWNQKEKFYPDALRINISTPVKNLFIGSAWSHQIGGIPSAIIAAYRCAEQIK